MQANNHIRQCLSIIIIALLSLPVFAQRAADKEEWQTLFNGKDIKDWVTKINHHETGDNYGNTFRVEAMINMTNSTSSLVTCIINNPSHIIIWFLNIGW
jgi:hypothetical protein